MNDPFEVDGIEYVRPIGSDVFIPLGLFHIKNDYTATVARSRMRFDRSDREREQYASVWLSASFPQQRRIELKDGAVNPKGDRRSDGRS